MKHVLLTIGALVVFAMPGAAQTGPTGTLVGSVARDSSGSMIGEAQVALPQLHRSIATNWLGEFQFSNVPPGRYAVTVRAIGFEPYIDSVEVKAGARFSADIVVTAAPVDLAAEKTTAEKRLPPGLQEMEERRTAGLGGHFVTDSMLRANDGKKLTYFLAQIPGLRQELSLTGPGIYIANGLRVGDGGPVFSSNHQMSDGTFPAGKCYVNIYLDGAPFFIGPAGPNNPPPDVEAMWAQAYSGVEYYSGGSEIPSQYNSSKSDCGVILLWSRRTP